MARSVSSSKISGLQPVPVYRSGNLTVLPFFEKVQIYPGFIVFDAYHQNLLAFFSQCNIIKN